MRRETTMATSRSPRLTRAQARARIVAEVRAHRRAGGGAVRTARGPNLATPCGDLTAKTRAAIRAEQRARPSIDLDALLVVDGVVLDRAELQGLVIAGIRGALARGR